QPIAISAAPLREKCGPVLPQLWLLLPCKRIRAFAQAPLMLDAIPDVAQLHLIEVELLAQGAAADVLPAGDIGGIIVGKLLPDGLDISVGTFQLAQKGAIEVAIKRAVSVIACHI